MSTNQWLMLGIFLLGAGTLVGIFKTKTEGFGRYTTAVVLLCLVLVVSAMLFVAGMIEGAIFVNVVFAITGFAGGIVTAKEP
jgi:hypothetical protein